MLACYRELLKYYCDIDRTVTFSNEQRTHWKNILLLLHTYFTYAHTHMRILLTYVWVYIYAICLQMNSFFYGFKNVKHDKWHGERVDSAREIERASKTTTKISTFYCKNNCVGDMMRHSVFFFFFFFLRNGIFNNNNNNKK